MRVHRLRAAIPLLAVACLTAGSAGAGSADARPAAPVAGPTSGLTLYSGTCTVQRPYDLPQSARFSVTGGPTYDAWILKGCKRFKQGSGTGPRTEMRWHTDGSGTEHQWSGDMLIDPGTSSACLMRVRGSTGGEAIHIDVHGDGNLHNSVSKTPIATGMWGKWFHLNADFDPATGAARVWIDGRPVLTTHYSAPTSKIWHFANGVHNTTGATAEAHIKNITFWTK